MRTAGCNLKLGKTVPGFFPPPVSWSYKASRSRPVSRVGGLSRMSGRPPRYALTCRSGRPGKPTSQSEAGRSPAKRDLYTIVTSLSNALNIWLAFKRTTFNVFAFCMAARTVAALIMSGAFFFEKGIVQVYHTRIGRPGHGP